MQCGKKTRIAATYTCRYVYVCHCMCPLYMQVCVHVCHVLHVFVDVIYYIIGAVGQHVCQHVSIIVNMSMCTMRGLYELVCVFVCNQKESL